MPESPIPQNSAVVPPPLPTVPLNYRSGSGGIDEAAWHTAGRLFAMDKAILPNRCIKCNGTEDVRMKRKQFTWAPPIVYLGLLGGLLPCIILVMVLQKKATVTYGMCAVHRRKRWNVTWISLGTLAFSIFLFVMAGVLENGIPVIFGILGILGALIYAAVAGPVLKPHKIDQSIIQLKGCGPVFLQSLPNTQWE